MNNKILKVKITENDLNSYKPTWKSAEGKEYPHSFSSSGQLIDELAYASNQWTEEDLTENNFEYAPNEPYNFNYEDDLFANTKTLSELQGLANSLDLTINEGLFTKMNLQAGAYCALHMPETWSELLEAYTDKLKQDRTDGISKAYNKELEAEQNSFWQDLIKEWLYGDRDSIGLIRNIQKYWNAESVEYDHKKGGSFSFYFDKEEAEQTLRDWNDTKATVKNYKHYLLERIVDECKGREYKEKQKAEKRKAERERVAEYNAEREAKKVAERKSKLLSMKLKIK